MKKKTIRNKRYSHIFVDYKINKRGRKLKKKWNIFKRERFYFMLMYATHRQKDVWG